MTKHPALKSVLAAAAGAITLALASTSYAQSAPRPSLEELQGIPDVSQDYGTVPALPDSSRNVQQPGDAGGARNREPVYVDRATVERIGNQAEGNYAPIDRSIGVPMGTTQDAWTHPYDNMSDGQIQPGVVRYHWNKEMVMPIRLREYMVTMIVLPGWEKVRDIYIGESYYFQAMIVRENSVALRSGAAGIDTSVTILGESGNLYTFYARAESFNTREISDLTVFIDAAPVNPGVWFNEAASDAGMMVAPGAGVAPALASGVAPAAAGTGAAPTVEGSATYLPSSDLQFVHKMYEVKPGDRSIAPEYVATDGRWTYFYYGEKAGTVDRPIVYRIVDGVETIVNTRTIGTKGETLVAEAVGEFVLRNGQRTVCVKLAPSAASPSVVASEQGGS